MENRIGNLTALTQKEINKLLKNGKIRTRTIILQQSKVLLTGVC